MALTDEPPSLPRLDARSARDAAEAEAEMEAAQIMAAYARKRGYLWASDGRSWRTTASCSLSCPTSPALWMPCPSQRGHGRRDWLPQKFKLDKTPI